MFLLASSLPLLTISCEFETHNPANMVWRAWNSGMPASFVRGKSEWLTGTIARHLENLRDPFAESVEGKIGDGMQIQLAHDISAVGLSRFYAEIQG